MFVWNPASCLNRSCLTCIEPAISTKHLSYQSFQLFGFDFMLDESFKVWLIEINGAPACAQSVHTSHLCQECICFLHLSQKCENHHDLVPYFHIWWRILYSIRVPQEVLEAKKQRKKPFLAIFMMVNFTLRLKLLEEVSYNRF